MKIITNELIGKYRDFLLDEEKSAATLKKYIRDVRAFAVWLKERELSKSVVLAYKEYLIGHYAPASVNSVLSSLNSFFSYNEWYALRVKTLKMQKQIFASSE